MRTYTATMGRAPAPVRDWNSRDRRVVATVVLLLAAAIVASTWMSDIAGEAILLLGLLLAFALAPPEFALAALGYGTLVISAFGGMQLFYVNVMRWAVISAGSGILYLRFARIPGSWRPRHTSYFLFCMSGYVVVAAFSATYSIAPRVTLLKAVMLAFAVGTCAAVTREIVSQCGPAAAGRLVRSWLWILAPAMAFHHYALWAGSTPALGSAFQLGLFRGGAGNANSLGALLCILLPYLVAHFAFRKLEWNRLQQVVFVAVVTLSCMLWLTHSRASVLGYGSAILLLMYLQPKSRLQGFVAIASAAMVLLMFVRPFDAVERAADWVYKDQIARGVLGSRIEQWDYARQMFLESPWLGSGFGITSERQAEWTVETNRSVQYEIGSSFWAVLAQLGILGAVLVFPALGHLLWRAIRLARRVRDPWLSAVVASAFAALVNSFFEAWMVSPGSGILWFFLIQCFLLDSLVARYRYAPRQPSWSRTQPFGERVSRFPAPAPAPAGD